MNPAAAQMMAAYFAQVAAQAQARGPPAPAPGAPAPVEAEPAPAARRSYGGASARSLPVVLFCHG